MKLELVKDWMTRDIVSVSPNTNLAEAHQLMTEHGVRRLPVIDHGHLIGIVTLGDVRGAEPSEATTLTIWELNYLLAKLNIGSIMTRRPITVSESATIGDAAKIMLDKRVSGLPVLGSHSKISGIITESDIFRMVIKAWHEDEDE